jgi:N-acetylmuramic acid 6-phosphate etherase
MPLPPDRSDVATEKRNPKTVALHAMDVEQIVAAINREDRDVHLALKRAGRKLTRLIVAIEPRFLAGGRLIYVGAGTSGRLGVLDASEAPPTFCVPPDRIVGIIAGGDASLRQSSEGKEDEFEGAWPVLRSLGLTHDDTVIAIAAGGTTPYALGALAFCRQECAETARPLTALLTCATIEGCEDADHIVMLKVGPEVLAGSTRLKAGSATKMALNTISTTLMVRSGRVYQNLMVDVRATNDKLRDRAARIIAAVTHVSRERAFDLLDRAGGSAKVAIVMHKAKTSPEGAQRLLDDAHGWLDVALGEREAGTTGANVHDNDDKDDMDDEVGEG